MIRNIFTLVLALPFFFGTAIAQESNIQPFSKTDARQTQSINKTNGPDQNGQAPSGGSTSITERCLQHSKTQALMDSDPQYRIGVEAARELNAQIRQEIESGTRATPPIYTIPVVFHVIHKGEAVGSGTNISTAQLQSAIAALNRDYRRTNADGGIAQGAGPDTEIQFCLAGVDPNGNPHSGINRVNGTSVTGYSANGITNGNEESVKDLSRWDNRYYLNIWVVSEIEGNGADVANPNNFTGGTLGYAYLPTNPVTWNADLDGIVALNLCVGNDPNGSNGYRLWFATTTNRTLTHEVGHFLGLNHTFSDSNPNACANGDGITDTPNAQQVNMFNCNYNGSCSNQMIENYMDYTPEECQDQFTAGQNTVMRATLTGARTALVNTNNCGVSTSFDAGISAISTPLGTVCQTTFSPMVTLNNYGSTTLTSVQIQYFIDANGPSTYNWTGSLTTNASTTVTLGSLTTTAGAHTFTARTVSGTLNGSNTDQVAGNNQSTSSFTVASGGSAVTLTLNLDCFGEEIDWEIRNSSNQLMASGGSYVNNASGQQVVQSLCLAEDCYDFIINDSYGDGLYGSQWSGCSINGNYSITDGNSTLVTITAPNSDFGSQAIHNFCIGGGGGTVCEELMSYDGDLFLVNTNDLPSFDVQAIDNDQQPVATDLATAGFNSEWMVFYEEVAPLDTNFFIGATSWFQNTTVNADNWLTFGPVTMLSEDGELRWKHRYYNNTYRDGYRVLVGTAGTDIANFNGATVLYSVADNAASTDGDITWTQQTVALPAGTYAGQSLYFAFHHNAGDELFLYLDDIEVEGCSSLTVGVDEEEQFRLNVFPNPSTGNFTFQYDSEASGDIEFNMMNSLGQQVWNYRTDGSLNGSGVIETSGLASGVYTLVVRGERLNASQRLILSK